MEMYFKSQKKNVDLLWYWRTRGCFSGYALDALIVNFKVGLFDTDGKAEQKKWGLKILIKNMN